MRGAVRVGRVAGIELTLDWSSILVFFLLTWNVTLVFEHWHPEWARALSVAVALVAALLFFASVLAHELAHALVAKSFGMQVRQIRLFLFGGVSDIEREPPSPRAELWMALAGPVLSLAVGFALTVVAGASLVRVRSAGAEPLAAIAQLGALRTLVFWLGPVNLGLGLFNLIPGFPLDGGRVLRATVWSATNDIHRATKIAAGAGRFIGLGFVLLGIAMALGISLPLLGSGAGGVWLALIGWFLKSAAERSFGALVTEEMLAGLRVSHLMRRDGLLLAPAASLETAADEMLVRSSDQAFPVVDNQRRLLGLLSFGGVRKVPRAEWSGVTVRDAMTPLDSLTVTAPDATAHEALQALGELDVDQLPVVDREALVGMLRRADIARWLELNSGARRRPRRTTSLAG